MILIACSSVFQLFVAIIIKKAFLSDKSVDLVLTDSTPVFKKLYNCKKLAELFDSVRYCEINANSRKLGRIQRSAHYRPIFEAFPHKYVKKIWGIDVRKYKECYFSSFALHNLMLQYAIKKNGKHTKIHMFEDGISTYLLKNPNKLASSRIAKKIFGIKPIEDIIDDVLVFEPDLVCVEEFCNLVSIPKPGEVDGVAEIFNEIFGKNDYRITERFVFFEESFNNDGYVTNDADLINKLWSVCEGKDFILKHHPRNSVDRFTEVLPTVDSPIFWEHYLLNNSIEDNVLVTVSSNTAFVPHIISGCTPNVVMLYKIFDGTSPLLGSDNFLTYVEKYLNLYKGYTDKKFYIPESVEEYIEIVNKLKRKGT